MLSRGLFLNGVCAQNTPPACACGQLGCPAPARSRSSGSPRSAKVEGASHPRLCSATSPAPPCALPAPPSSSLCPRTPLPRGCQSQLLAGMRPLRGKPLGRSLSLTAPSAWETGRPQLRKPPLLSACRPRVCRGRHLLAQHQRPSLVPGSSPSARCAVLSAPSGRHLQQLNSPHAQADPSMLASPWLRPWCPPEAPPSPSDSVPRPSPGKAFPLSCDVHSSPS